MKKINIGPYLEPNGTELDARDRGTNGSDESQHDPTYSVLLGYGFRPRPKRLDNEIGEPHTQGH